MHQTILANAPLYACSIIARGIDQHRLNLGTREIILITLFHGRAEDRSIIFFLHGGNFNLIGGGRIHQSGRFQSKAFFLLGTAMVCF